MSVSKAALLIGLLLLPVSFAVPPPGPEPSDAHYRSQTGTGETWNGDISTGGSMHLPADGFRTNCIPIGFSVKFFEMVGGCVYIWDDGIVTFNTFAPTFPVPEWNVDNYPTNMDYTIALLHQDIDLSKCGGTIRSGTRTDAGVTSFYVQYINVHHKDRVVTNCATEPGSNVQLRIEAESHDINILVQNHAYILPAPTFDGSLGIEGQNNIQAIDYGDGAKGGSYRFYRNTGPVAGDVSYAAPEGGSVSFTLDATDKEGDAVATWQLDTTEVTAGTITGTAPDLTYNAPSMQVPTQVLRYRAYDTIGNWGNWARVDLNVIPINDPPSFTLGPDQLVGWGSIPHNVPDHISDIEIGAGDLGQTVEFLVSPDDPTAFINQPTYYLAGDTAGLMYRLRSDYLGTVNVQVIARDNGGTLVGGVDTSAPQTFTITAYETPPHALPIVQDLEFTIPEDTPLPIELVGYDPESRPITFHIDTLPAGSLSPIVGESLTYMPLPDANGIDSFTYYANDGELDGESGMVTITISPVNDAPRPIFDVVQAHQDLPSDVWFDNLLANDYEPDGDVMTLGLATPEFGYFTPFAGGETYVPTNDFFGVDTSLQTVSDPYDYTGQSLLYIGVSAAGNDLPSANADSFTINEDDVLAIDPMSLLANDAGLETPEILLLTGASNGVVTGMTYTPDAEWSGVDNLVYLLHDGSGGVALGNVEIIVNEVDDPPVASFTYASTPVLGVNSPIAFTDTSMAGDHPLLSWSWDFGDATSNDPHPTHTFLTTGEKMVTLTVMDTVGKTHTATLTLPVTNEAPTVFVTTTGLVANRETILQATASDADGIQQILWDLGNGWTANGANVRHTYQAGTYVVKVTAYDKLGASQTAVHVITVSASEATTPSQFGSGGSHEASFKPIQETPKISPGVAQKPPVEETEAAPTTSEPEVPQPATVLPTYHAQTAATGGWIGPLIIAGVLLLCLAVATVAIIRVKAAKS